MKVLVSAFGRRQRVSFSATDTCCNTYAATTIMHTLTYLPTVPFLPGLSRFFSSVDLKKWDVPFFRISELLFYLFIFSSFYLIFFLKKKKETRSHTHWRIKVRALITKTPRSDLGQGSIFVISS